MAKYKLLHTNGLKELLEVNPRLYSPDGNKLIAFHNGILGGQLMYDHKSKKVYGLTLKEVDTKEEDFVWLRELVAKDMIKHKMSGEEALMFIQSKGYRI